MVAHCGRGVPDRLELPEGARPAQGIRDYDVFYFDAEDQTWEGEDAGHSARRGVVLRH